MRCRTCSRGARTLLVAAGMPGFFWSYAAPCYMHLDNCLPRPTTGQSAWYRRFGEEFTGQLIPFGSVVIFKPSPTQYKTVKPLQMGMYGIFLGYRLAPGGTWNGEYLVEDLSYFTDIDFRMDALGHRKTLSPTLLSRFVSRRGRPCKSLCRDIMTGPTSLSRAFSLAISQRRLISTFPTGPMTRAN